MKRLVRVAANPVGRIGNDHLPEDSGQSSCHGGSGFALDAGSFDESLITYVEIGIEFSHLESRFDFTYLDSIREITQLHYDSCGQRVQNTKIRGQRDWKLHQINEIQKLYCLLKDNLSMTQRRQIRETLISTINRWWQMTNLEALKSDDVYRDFVKATLQRAGDGRLWEQVCDDENESAWLIECCTSGFLFDVLELYLTALRAESSE